MLERFDHPHLRAVFAAAPESNAPRDVAIGIVGVAVPVLIGWLIGQTHLGLGIGLGAMLLGGGARAPGALFESIALSLLAVAAGVLFAATPWGDAALIVLAGLAAVVGGYSKAWAIGSVRFCVYLVLCVAVLEDAPDRWVGAGAFALGAVWNIALRRLIGGIAAADPPSPYSHPQRIAAFRRRLRGWSAWQYACG